MKSLYRLITVMMLITFVLSACAPQTATQPAQSPKPTEASSATEASSTQNESNTPQTGDQATTAPQTSGSPSDYLNAAREDTLIVDNPYRLEGKENWNPYTPGNVYGLWGMSAIGQDSLEILNYGDGELKQWAAESFDADADSKVWTLKLKPGVTWNDGVAFTVDDIIFSIELQMKPENETLGNHIYYVEWIDKMEKVDDLTMKFYLKKPNVRFALENFGVQITSANPIVPKHIWETVKDPNTFKNYDPEKGLPLGTGPYILAKITENETIWVRNDNWWGYKTGFRKLPEPKKVIFSYVGTEEVRTQTAIENGFDTMQDMTFGAFQALKAQNDKWQTFYADKPYAWPDPCARILSINNSVAPWDDKEMRWVLNYVMDRQQIVDIAYEGTTTMGLYFWPDYPSMKKYDDLIPQDVLEKFKKPNLDEAAKILTAKGYTKSGQYWTKDGKELGLEIQVPSYIELERIGDVFIEQLQKFGINATKTKLDNAFYDNFNYGNYTSQSNWNTCGSVAEPWLTLRTLAGKPAPQGEAPKVGETNGFRWNNERYTELVNEIGTLKWDDPKMSADVKEALTILYDELPAIPTANARKLVPFNYTYWTGWPNSENYYMPPTNWWNNFVWTITTIEKAK
jgi:peptide/nickel transport system substrate-binding protein